MADSPLQSPWLASRTSSRQIDHFPGQALPFPSDRTPGARAYFSGAAKDGFGRTGEPEGITGSTRRDPAEPPNARRVVIACGVGQIIGHRAFEIATRMRCPLGNTHDVKCISTSRG